MKKVRERYKMTELGEIPEEWSCQSLESISNITRLAGAEYSDIWETDSNGSIIALRGNNIGQNKLILNDVEKISERMSNRLIRSKLFKNDIVFPCVGTIGKATLIKEDNKYHINQNIAKITPDKKIEPLYLTYFLMSKFTQKQIFKYNTSSSQPNILVGNLRKFLVIIPVLKEQQKIADILSIVDEHIEETESLIEKIKELKKGLMQRLLTKGIGHTKFKKTEVGEIPVEWEVKTIGELIENSIPGEWGKEAESLKDALPIIRSTNFCNNGKLDLNNIAYRKIDPSKVNKVIINRGDILLEKSGGGPDQPVGRVVYFNENGTFGYANFIQKLVINKKYNSKTIFYFLHYFYLTGQVLRYQQQTTGIINFQLKDFLDTAKIGIPINLQEQNEISNILTKVDDKIEYYEDYKDNLNVLKNGLMQKLLTGKIRVRI